MKNNINHLHFKNNIHSTQSFTLLKMVRMNISHEFELHAPWTVQIGRCRNITTEGNRIRDCIQVEKFQQNSTNTR